MLDLDNFNLARDGVYQHLQQKEGVKYVVPDVLLVKAIRQALHQNRRDISDQIFAYLMLNRYKNIMTYTFFYGLSRFPHLMEEAIAGLIERVWKDICEEKDVFIEQNFYVYLKRAGVDVYKKVQTSEGLQSRMDNSQGSRPHHIPQSLIVSIETVMQTDDAPSSITPIDPFDPIADLEQRQHIASLLQILPEPTDRLIVFKRAILGQQWDEIARDLQKSDRTVRTHFEDARQTLLKYIQGGEV